MKVIVFTDLDGTLLDEETYLPASSLRHLQDTGASVIFCSSKTRKEQEAIRSLLNIHDPFIVENGSAIIIPPNTIDVKDNLQEADGTKILILGMPVSQISAALHEIRTETGLNFECLCELTIEQIKQLTGLDFEASKRAKLREYSDSIVTKLKSKEREIILQACEMRRLQCALGGRFLGVTGREAHKGNAIKLLTEYYQSQFGKIITIGIGDSPNDAPMLEAVDLPYLVQRPAGKEVDVYVVNPKLKRLNNVGPLGFDEMVSEIKTVFQ